MTTISEHPAYLTPREIAEHYGGKVGIGRILGWIRRGELPAENVSGEPRSQKPRYLVPVEAFRAFQAGRPGCQPKPVRRRQKKYVSEIV